MYTFNLFIMSLKQNILASSYLSYLDENYKYYNGDTWDYWIGASVPIGAPRYQEIIAGIRKVFQSNNIIKECTDRLINGLIGNPPNWYINDNQNNESDVEVLLQKWINQQKKIGNNRLGYSAILQSVTDLFVIGKSCLRLFKPDKFINSGVLNSTILHAPHPNNVEVYKDDDGFVDYVMYHFYKNKMSFIEKHFVDEKGITHIQILKDNKVITDNTYSMDGRLLISVIETESVITDSIKSTQNAINFALTMMNRNIEQAGFRERIILNAQPPGRWEGDKFIPEPEFRIGAGQTSFIQGIPNFDISGEHRGYTNPSVSITDPVNVENFTKTIEFFSTLIYKQMYQSHLLNSDLQVSGISRKQSRVDFDDMLKSKAALVENAYSNILTNVAQLLTGNSYNIVVELDTKTGIPTPEELSSTLEYYNAGLLSRTTTLELSRFTNDPDAENELIKREKAESGVVENVTSLVTSGLLDQDTATKLLKEAGIEIPQDLGIIDGTETNT